jgi:hypothetical protein
LFTGQGGDLLRLSQALLPDLERVLGVDHQITLTTRNNIALFTGQGGDLKEGLRPFGNIRNIDVRRSGGPCACAAAINNARQRHIPEWCLLVKLRMLAILLSVS